MFIFEDKVLSMRKEDVYPKYHTFTSDVTGVKAVYKIPSDIYNVAVTFVQALLGGVEYHIKPFVYSMNDGKLAAQVTLKRNESTSPSHHEAVLNNLLPEEFVALICELINKVIVLPDNVEFIGSQSQIAPPSVTDEMVLQFTIDPVNEIGGKEVDEKEETEEKAVDTVED